MSEPHIVVTGNPVDGFVYYGPYPNSDDAVSAGEELGSDWWIAPLLPEPAENVEPEKAPVAKVVVVENPEGDPSWFAYGGEVEVSTMTSFPFSKHATEEAAREATEEWLAVLRNEDQPAEFRAWLKEWLKDELSYGSRRDFTVYWDGLSIIDDDPEPPEEPDMSGSTRGADR